LISSARGGNLFCETKTRIRASPKRVLAALQGPWTWWRGGAYDNRQVLPSGEISYELWPGIFMLLFLQFYNFLVKSALAFGRSRVGVHVFERMSPPIQIPGGFRIPLQLAGSCSGQAYFELTSDDGGASTTVVGRFAAVSNHVLVMTDRIFVETHLKAERGGLTLPFKPGTGWPGLKDLLENNQRPRSPADILRGN
jgi:hypothetical protein